MSEPIDQHKIPWATVHGAGVEKVLLAGDLENWYTQRNSQCGHVDMNIHCRTCRELVNVTELMGVCGAVRLIPRMV